MTAEESRFCLVVKRRMLWELGLPFSHTFVSLCCWFFYCFSCFGLSSLILPLLHCCSLKLFHPQDPMLWVKASGFGRSQFPWKTVEPPSQLTMQCCGNANISFWVHTLTLFLALLSACLVRTMPTVISNITFANQHTAEIFFGIFPMKWHIQLWKSIFNYVCLCACVFACARVC